MSYLNFVNNDALIITGHFNSSHQNSKLSTLKDNGRGLSSKASLDPRISLTLNDKHKNLVISQQKHVLPVKASHSPIISKNHSRSKSMGI